jgi:hypothetical protein
MNRGARIPPVSGAVKRTTARSSVTGLASAEVGAWLTINSPASENQRVRELDIQRAAERGREEGELSSLFSVSSSSSLDGRASAASLTPSVDGSCL